jgi:NMD protein affecting ribosome stability and mRNA decay
MNFRQTYCSDCARIRRRATANRFYYNHRKPRLCPDCGKRNAKKFKTLCEPCRAKHRKRSDALYDLKHKS